jgi:hypothetical protein
VFQRHTKFCNRRLNRRLTPAISQTGIGGTSPSDGWIETQAKSNNFITTARKMCPTHVPSDGDFAALKSPDEGWNPHRASGTTHNIMRHDNLVRWVLPPKSLINACRSDGWNHPQTSNLWHRRPTGCYWIRIKITGWITFSVSFYRSQKNHSFPTGERFTRRTAQFGICDSSLFGNFSGVRNSCLFQPLGIHFDIVTSWKTRPTTLLVSRILPQRTANLDLKYFCYSVAGRGQASSSGE